MDILLKINTYINRNNFNKSEISRQMGRSRQNFYDVLNGKQKLYVEFLINISESIGVRPGYWFEEENQLTANKTQSEYINTKTKDMIKQLEKDLEYFRERVIKLEQENEALKSENNTLSKEAI